MCRCRFYFLVFYSLHMAIPSAVASPSSAPGKVLNIGVLAHRGHELTVKRWRPTATYLSQQTPYTFRIIPLTNDDIGLSVEQGRVDFVLTNPASYAVLEARYGVRRLATLLNVANGGSHIMFGAVIFTRHDRDDIQTLKDIAGKRFMAVHQNAFGGWWMAWRELMAKGLNPMQDFSELVFANFPQDQIVYAVRDGHVDAGTVRTSVLERMNEAGKVKLEEFKIINAQKSFIFKQHLSTRLYPEWPISATRHVSIPIVQQLTLALLNMPADSVPARAAKIKGWTSPLDYQPVFEMMRELRVGPYATLGQLNFKDVINNYGYWLLALFTLFMFMIIGFSWIVGMNRRYVSLNRNLEREIAVREQLEEKLKFQALHDPLTKLPNRSLLLDRLHQEIFLSERERKYFAVANIDLDNFKQVNDKYGHVYGDKLLVEIAERFMDSVRKTDTIARFGGDEFVLLLDHFLDRDVVSKLAEKILICLREPFSVSGNEFYMSASVGVAIYPDHGDSVNMLMRRADLAMYQAKQKGNCVVVYDHSDSLANLKENNQTVSEPV